MNKVTKSIGLALYADMGSTYGKGPRLSKINELLRERDIVAKIYCRHNKGDSDSFINSPPLVVKLWIFVNILMSKIFSKSELFGRNLQEDVFDSWLSKKIEDDVIFIAPGFWKTAERFSSSDEHTVIVHSVICHPKWVSERLKFIISSTLELDIPFSYQHIVNESIRVQRVIDTQPYLFFPSESVAATYRKYLDESYFSSNTLTNTNWITAIPPAPAGNASLNPLRYGFVGTVSALKGVHLLIKSFTMKFSTRTLFVYGPMDPQLNLFMNDAINISNNIKLKGMKTIVEISKEIDVLIVPSIIDAEPRVIREFLTLGKWVICTEDITAIDHQRLLKFCFYDTPLNFCGALENSILRLDKLITGDDIQYKRDGDLVVEEISFEDDLVDSIEEYLYR